MFVPFTPLFISFLSSFPFPPPTFLHLFPFCVPQFLLSIVSLPSPLSHYLIYLFNSTQYVAGKDYLTAIKILEFEPGVTDKEVTINIIDDKLIEVDENFVLYLSSGAGAFLSPFAQAEVTIINNDGRHLYWYRNS